MARLLQRDPRKRALADSRRRDVVRTRNGWLIDLAADRRLAAVGVLAGEEGDDVTGTLLELLGDPVDVVRAAAIDALAGRGSLAVARSCAREAPAWDAAGFPAAREAAWQAIAQTAADDVPALLTTSLLSRAAAASPVGDAAAALAAGVAGRPDRAEAALAVVVRHLGGRDPEVAARATQLVTTLGAGHEHLLAAALADDARAAHAACALGELGSLTSVAPLAELLRTDRPAPARTAAAYALGAIGGREAATVLWAAVDDQDAQVRRAVAASLAPLAGVFLAESGDGPERSRPLLLPAAPPPAESDGSSHGQVGLAAETVAQTASEPVPVAAPDADPGSVQASPHETADPTEDHDDVVWVGTAIDLDEELGEFAELEGGGGEGEDADVTLDDHVFVDVDVDEEPLGGAPDIWSGPKTDGVPAVKPRMAPARAPRGTRPAPPSEPSPET